MAFSDNLKRLRLAKGITQSELGESVGVHANHISRYERGDSSPSAEVLKSFAEALDVTIDELVIGDRKRQMLDNFRDMELIRLLKRLEELSEEERSTVKDLISAFIFRNETRKKLAV